MKNFLFFFCAFLGGVCGSVLFSATSSIAAKEQRFYTTNFYNEQGKRIGVIGAQGSGEGSLFLFNDKSKTTVQMGAYSRGGEKGQSLLGLHDRKGALRLLFRMHGGQDAPTVVMKDGRGADRIVFGLDGNTETPYFRYTDANGRWQNLF